jgi:hypothetical protein
VLSGGTERRSEEIVPMFDCRMPRLLRRYAPRNDRCVALRAKEVISFLELSMDIGDCHVAIDFIDWLLAMTD